MISRTPAEAKVVLLVPLLAACVLAGCGGTRAPQAKGPGKAQLTAADLGHRVQKVLVADKEVVAMVGRDGCHATVRSGTERNLGQGDELRVRCPRKERLAAWFAGIDRAIADVELAEVTDDDDDGTAVPAAEIVLGQGRGHGTVLRLVKPADVAKLVSEVRAFGAELESAEIPRPGPASPSGWQMVRVTGAAHVLLGGAPARGVLDARLSTSGQYFCEFVSATEDGSVRATKSGWITAPLAARALDEVLGPFRVQGEADAKTPALVAATRGGAERRADIASTAAVFERFAPLQDALGDACLPELEPPGSSAGL